MPAIATGDRFGTFRKLVVLYFGVLIIRILLFRVLHSGPPFRRKLRSLKISGVASGMKSLGFRGFGFRGLGFRVYEPTTDSFIKGSGVGLWVAHTTATASTTTAIATATTTAISCLFATTAAATTTNNR